MNVVNIEHTTKNFHTLDVKFNKKELKILNTGRYSLEIKSHFLTQKEYESKMVNEMKIVSIILNYFRINMDEIKEMNRHKIYVDARMYICYFLRKHTHLSLYKIGQLIGRDHASVIHMIKRYNVEIMYDDTREVKREIDNIFTELNII